MHENQSEEVKRSGISRPFIGLLSPASVLSAVLEGRPFGLLSNCALLPIRLFGSYFYGMPEMRY